MEGAVKFLSLKEEVNACNESNLRLLPGQSRTYICCDNVDWRNEDDRDWRRKGERTQSGSGTLKALRDHCFVSRSELQVDSPVVLLVNLDLRIGLVNGGQGRVVGFKRLDCRAHLRLDNVSEIAAFKEAQILRFVSTNAVKKWPVVLFSNGVKRTITPFCAFIELGSENSFSRLSRAMIPLLSAWAISIHRSQGLTLENVEVDLLRSFEKKHVYVVLSRARGMDGSWVRRMPKDKSGGMNREVKACMHRSFSDR